jgi:Kef-type K+ transport system membrane component KefB
LLLIVFGIGCQFAMKYFGFELGASALNLLQLLGIVGLIMIVLEAALDLRLTRDKGVLILKAFVVALLALAGSSIALAYIINYFLEFEFYIALVYAIPLSVMSSAIIIPSVKPLSENKREFMIYESTFSDILGIMLFYFAISTSRDATPVGIVQDVGLNVLITVGLSVLISYLLVLLFQKIQESARLFLLISILIALYAIRKIFHLSSLIVILVFGLTLSNYRLFFSGKLRKLIDGQVLKQINREFHLVTLESAFIVRTFFFLVFGMTLDLGSLLNLNTTLISVSLVAALYLVRFVCLRLFLKSVNPEIFIAPRGLITILLFFGIPEVFVQDQFSSGILLYAILLTGLVMMFGMILHKEEADDVDELEFSDLESLDKELVRREEQ